MEFEVVKEVALALKSNYTTFAVLHRLGIQWQLLGRVRNPNTPLLQSYTA
jgi:hypothetical protein